MVKVSKCKECDWRVESLEPIGEKVWDVSDRGNFNNPTQLVEERASVYGINVVCEVCRDKKYTEKTCYNQAEIPKKGESIRIDERSQT